MAAHVDTYIAKRLFEVTKGALDEELVRLKDDPALVGATVEQTTLPRAMVFALLKLATFSAGAIVTLDATGSDEGLETSAARMEEPLIQATIQIMREELRRLGGPKDGAWPGPQPGRA